MRKMRKSLKEKAILQLLLDELQAKKEYQPYRATSCDFCFSDIQEGDEFYFMEAKRKICPECLSEISEYLEVKLQEI